MKYKNLQAKTKNMLHLILWSFYKKTKSTKLIKLYERTIKTFTHYSK